MTDISVEQLPPDEAFDLLAHELRFDILRALNDADGGLPFSDLRATVDVRDSGRFNYHLEQLVDRFVRKSGEEYRLSPAGKRAVGAVLSGGYTHIHEADPVPMSASCMYCGAGLEAQFTDERVRIVCTSCEWTFTEPTIPPSTLDGWDRDDVPYVVHRWTRRLLTSSNLGLCQYCDGRVDMVLCQPGDDAAPDWFEPETADHEATVVYDCQRCGHRWHAMVEIGALSHPAVIAFHYDHGIDLRETPVWELDWYDEPRSTVRQDDPLRVELRITLEEETRIFVFDDAMNLVSENAESRPSSTGS
ncbi:MAG: helix-turn-helix domain-containing protein [Halobacteria archaeon]|nr:helix-turn-helix domain-containing protein [Halobacteria archaeon]